MPCSDWRSGHVGNITLSCTVGVTAVVSNTCVSVDHCDAGSDDCVGPVGFESNHTCIPTGAGTHDCACLANAFGDAGPTTGCTFCPANSVSPDASTLVTDCVCAAGYGVAGDGTNQAVADGTTACDLVTCPLHSTRAADGTDTCACDIGYTVEPALDTSTNTYASISVTDASAPGFGYGAIDACSVCTLLFWKEATTSLCLPCTTCADGKFQSAACAGEGSVTQADTVCTDCAVVASAAGSNTPNDPADDATYTCTAADNHIEIRSESQILVTGFSKIQVFIPQPTVTVSGVRTHSTRQYTAEPISVAQPYYTDRQYVITDLPDYMKGL